MNSAERIYEKYFQSIMSDPKDDMLREDVLRKESMLKALYEYSKQRDSEQPAPPPAPPSPPEPIIRIADVDFDAL